VPLAQFLRPNPDLCGMLARYPQRKVILTNADAAHARRVLTVLGLQDCFKTIIDIKAMAPYCKPMPEAFQIALQRAGEPDASRCVLVDDAGHNCRAARQMGLYTIRIGSGPEEDAHASIEELMDLPRVLPPDGAFNVEIG
jgi:putative hydrolase of the HAD superfamily